MIRIFTDITLAAALPVVFFGLAEEKIFLLPLLGLSPLLSFLLARRAWQELSSDWLA